MKDTHLLPYILPNVFAISQSLSSTQFASLVLPSLKPLFAIKEPPQNMLTLLDNLILLQEKTDKAVFRERKHLPVILTAYLLRSSSKMFYHSFTTPWSQNMLL